MFAYYHSHGSGSIFPYYLTWIWIWHMECISMVSMWILHIITHMDLAPCLHIITHMDLAPCSHIITHMDSYNTGAVI